MGLESQSCVPCKGGIPPLTLTEAEQKLSLTPGWKLAEGGNKLVRNIEFKNFKSALAFVNRVGEVAEAENHHPDITFGWGYVSIEILTHKIGGLHENDFVLAAKISALLEIEP